MKVIDLIIYNNAPQLGDNCNDYLCFIEDDNKIIHTIWISMSTLLRKLHNSNVKSFYKNKIENFGNDFNLDQKSINNLFIYKPGIKDNIYENKCYYSVYPKIVFTSRNLE